MRTRLLISLAASSAIVVSAVLAPQPLAGQSKAAAPKAKKWAQPKTPDGQPDLQGVWTNATITPFERPTSMAGKAFLNEEEAAALERQSAERRATVDEAPARPRDVGNHNDSSLDSGPRVVSTRQPSPVVAPPP